MISRYILLLQFLLYFPRLFSSLWWEEYKKDVGGSCRRTYLLCNPSPSKCEAQCNYLLPQLLVYITKTTSILCIPCNLLISIRMLVIVMNVPYITLRERFIIIISHKRCNIFIIPFFNRRKWQLGKGLYVLRFWFGTHIIQNFMCDAMSVCLHEPTKHLFMF